MVDYTDISKARYTEVVYKNISGRKNQMDLGSNILKKEHLEKWMTFREFWGSESKSHNYQFISNFDGEDDFSIWSESLEDMHLLRIKKRKIIYNFVIKTGDAKKNIFEYLADKCLSSETRDFFFCRNLFDLAVDKEKISTQEGYEDFIDCCLAVWGVIDSIIIYSKYPPRQFNCNDCKIRIVD